MKFLSPDVALYLYKSTIWPRMECCCHVCTGAPKCYLELLDKLQKRYPGLLVLYLLPLMNPWFIVEMLPAEFFSIDINLVDVYLNWLTRFHFIIEGGLLVVPINCMIFLSPFLDVTRMSMSTVSFLTQLDS